MLRRCNNDDLHGAVFVFGHLVALNDHAEHAAFDGQTFADTGTAHQCFRDGIHFLQFEVSGQFKTFK